MRLSQLLDPIGVRTHILEESNIGKKKHPAGDWGYLRDYMSIYAKVSNPDDVIALLEQEGITSDFDLARYLLKFDKIID